MTTLAIDDVKANLFCTNCKCTNHTMETYHTKEEVIYKCCWGMLLGEWQRFNKAECYQKNGGDSTRQNEDG